MIHRLDKLHLPLPTYLSVLIITSELDAIHLACAEVRLLVYYMQNQKIAATKLSELDRNIVAWEQGWSPHSYTH